MIWYLAMVVTRQFSEKVLGSSPSWRLSAVPINLRPPVLGGGSLSSLPAPGMGLASANSFCWIKGRLEDTR